VERTRSKRRINLTKDQSSKPAVGLNCRFESEVL